MSDPLLNMEGAVGGEKLQGAPKQELVEEDARAQLERTQEELKQLRGIVVEQVRAYNCWNSGYRNHPQGPPRLREGTRVSGRETSPRYNSVSWMESRPREH